MSTWDADSRFAKAQAADPEYARIQVEELAKIGEENVAKWRPRPLDWTLDREMQAMIYDRLGQLTSIAAELPAAVKTRRPAPEAFPRPVTEVDRQRAEWRALQDRAYQNRIEDIVARGQARWRERVERGENPYGDGAPSLQIVQDGDVG